MSKFTDAELEIMQVLWDHGTLSPPEIQQNFSRPINNATLRSLLMILVEKGHLQREKVGKRYYYTAVTRKENTLQTMLSRIIDTFYEGSSTALITQLMKSEELSEDDIKELKKVANTRIRKTQKSKSKGKKS